MSSEKDKVNRNKLRGKEKLKYEFYDKVMRSKASSDTWDAFRKSLQTEGLDFRFHYNSRPLKSILVSIIEENSKLNPLINLQVFLSLQRETCRFYDYKASS